MLDMVGFVIVFGWVFVFVWQVCQGSVIFDGCNQIYVGYVEGCVVDGCVQGFVLIWFLQDMQESCRIVLEILDNLLCFVLGVMDLVFVEMVFDIFVMFLVNQLCQKCGMNSISIVSSLSLLIYMFMFIIYFVVVGRLFIVLLGDSLGFYMMLILVMVVYVLVSVVCGCSLVIVSLMISRLNVSMNSVKNVMMELMILWFSGWLLYSSGQIWCGDCICCNCVLIV